MVTLQREYEGTIKKGLLRILGQVVGGALAFVFLVCLYSLAKIAGGQKHLLREI